MPRAFSIAIQSDTVARRSPLPWTAPASVITRACRARASVRVDLPASGWLMTAKVRRGRVSGTARIYRPESPISASGTRWSATCGPRVSSSVGSFFVQAEHHAREPYHGDAGPQGGVLQLGARRAQRDVALCCDDTARLVEPGPLREPDGGLLRLLPRRERQVGVGDGARCPRAEG